MASYTLHQNQVKLTKACYFSKLRYTPSVSDKQWFRGECEKSKNEQKIPSRIVQFTLRFGVFAVLKYVSWSLIFVKVQRAICFYVWGVIWNILLLCYMPFGLSHSPDCQQSWCYVDTVHSAERVDYSNSINPASA